jgi:hypothetical protein
VIATLLALTDNFWLVFAAVIGSLVAVAGTVVGTWLLSWLQERARFRHAIRMVATEVGDNAADVTRWERQDISMDELRRRLATDTFEATRFDLAPLARTRTGLWAVLMDAYRRVRQSIEIGREPPSSRALNSLFDDLMDYWHIPLRQRIKMARASREWHAADEVGPDS